MLPPLCAAAALLAVPAVPANTGPPLSPRIDKFITAGYPDYARHAAPVAADTEFLRRATLDLTGTIPTAAETRAFLADRSPDKRAKLVDRLLASPAYARRMAQVFDVVFMERRKDVRVPRTAWEEYLRESFGKNKPYDQLAREILSADGADPKNRAPAKFYLDREFETALVTRDVARVFLGKNIQCAQCHDHPLVDDYKQEHFHGILAFLNRSYLFPNTTDAKAVLAEKADGDVTFVNVFDKTKATKGTSPRLPGGKPVAEPKAEKGKEYKVAPAKDVRPVPAYSRRAQLAKLITARENPAFARTAANRLWAMMLGRGLVNPVDLDHSGNPPSHPELLDLLGEEFAARGYDVKWLLREIALSDTYQRSSEVPSGLTDVPADRYLVAALKPLAAEQLAYAVAQATGPGGDPPVDRFVRVFGGRPGEPDDGSAPTLDQTLFLKHGGIVRGMIAPKAGNLVDRLAKLSDPSAAADELFLSVLTRPPTTDERRDVANALKGAPDKPAVLTEVVWALVASAEFRFNH